MSQVTVDVTIFDRMYSFKCAQDEVSLLKKSSSYLDSLMKQMQSKGFNQRSDIAVMVAINLASMLLKQQNDESSPNKHLDIEAKLNEIHDELKDMLAIPLSN